MFDKNSISNIIFSFGTPHGNKFGTLVLNLDGTVQGYKHENEQYWELDNSELIFLNKKKIVTSRLKYIEQLRAWFGIANDKKIPIYLYPLLDLNAPTNTNKNLPPLVLNGVPHNGSIFFEKALNKCGWTSSKLTLIGKNIVDIISDTNELDKKRLECPVQLIPSFLHGQTVITNLDTPEIIKSIRVNKIPIITITRNIKDTILDLFEVELNKKNSKLKNLSEKKQSEEFVALYGSSVLLHMRNVARAIISDRPKIILRYEDNIEGRISEDIGNILDSYQPGTSKILAEELPKEYNDYIDKKIKI